MTLKEKFLELAFAKISSEDLRDECEKIAEEFAVEFAEWMSDNATEIQKTGNYKGKYFLLKKGDFFTAKELLKLFKKEKGYE